MRKRAAIVLFNNGKVALIKRVRDDKTYYVFPGGGIEKNETPKDAAKREAREELGLEVEIGPCLFELTENLQEFYFLAEETGGIFGTGSGEEFTSYHPERGSYEAVWMPMELLPSITLYPVQFAAELDNVYRLNFGR